MFWMPITKRTNNGDWNNNPLNIPVDYNSHKDNKVYMMFDILALYVMGFMLELVSMWCGFELCRRIWRPVAAAAANSVYRRMTETTGPLHALINPQTGNNTEHFDFKVGERQRSWHISGTWLYVWPLQQNETSF